jgi:hypothetical protein
VLGRRERARNASATEDVRTSSVQSPVPVIVNVIVIDLRPSSFSRMDLPCHPPLRYY